MNKPLITSITRLGLTILSFISGFWIAPGARANAVRPVITVTSPTYAYPIPVGVTFQQDGDANVSVTGFDVSDLNVTNANVVANSFSGLGHAYTFNLTPTSDPAQITVSIPAGAANGDSNASVANSITIEYFWLEVTRAADLALWYRFNETSGGTALDSSGNGQDGTLRNMDDADWVDGKYGNAIDLDGNNDDVLTPLDGHHNMDYSWSVWINTTDGNGGILSITENNWSQGGKGLYVSGGNPKIDAGWVSNGIGPIALNDGSWHHVALTIKDSQSNSDPYVIYLDGVSTKSGAMDWFQFDGTAQDLRVGYIGIDDGKALAGKLDDLRIYEGELTAADVAAIYAGDIGTPKISGLATASANPGFPLTLSDLNATVTHSLFPPTWSAAGLPAGLTIDATTGVISGTPTGTPTATGTKSDANVTATNGYGSTNHALAITLFPLPSVANIASATELSLYGAKANGSFTDSTGTDCLATVYVDTTDKGTSDASAWSYSFPLGTVEPGDISREVTGLAIDTTYRYRFSVANAGGIPVWTNAAGSFTTLPQTIPSPFGRSQRLRHNFLLLHRQRHARRHRRRDPHRHHRVG